MVDERRKPISNRAYEDPQQKLRRLIWVEKDKNSGRRPSRSATTFVVNSASVGGHDNKSVERVDGDSRTARSGGVEDPHRDENKEDGNEVDDGNVESGGDESVGRRPSPSPSAISSVDRRSRNRALGSQGGETAATAASTSAATGPVAPATSAATGPVTSATSTDTGPVAPATTAVTGPVTPATTAATGPAASVAVSAARLQTLREMSPPRTDCLVTVAAMMKHARRLAFRVDEMAVDVPAGHRHRAAVDELANRVWWLMRDLDVGARARAGGSDWLMELLDRYNRCQDAYFALRDCVYGVLAATDGDHGSGAETGGSSGGGVGGGPGGADAHVDDRDPATTSRGRPADEDGASVRSRVHQCPGVLDVTVAGQPEKADGRAAAAATKKCGAYAVLARWASAVCEYLCWCLPSGHTDPCNRSSLSSFSEYFRLTAVRKCE